MSKKISTLVLKVDLQCEVCSKKIRKVLGKLQDRENIQSVVYDEKGNEVIVSGPFDPKKLSKKLCCKACKVIKDIIINSSLPPPPPPPTPPPPPRPPTPRPPPPPPPTPPPRPPTPRPPPPPPTPPPPPPPPSSPKHPCSCQYPYAYLYPCHVVCPFIPVCGCHGRCNCKLTAEPSLALSVPPVVPICSPPCYDGCRTCKFICEDEPSFCSTM